MKFSRRLLHWLFSYPGEGLLCPLILATCRIRAEGVEHLQETLASPNPCIVALWHNRLLLSLYAIKRYAKKSEQFRAVISRSRDGLLLASVLRKYSPRFGVIPVAHNKREQALARMIATLRKNHSSLLITPDGPRGPVYKAKPGLAKAAVATRAQVLPFTWSANRYWELKTWDKTRVFQPFSKITLSFGPPITPEEGESVPEFSKRIEKALG